jgi:serine phosphatase RsbU (regulator of sigma subunit)/CHASE2 domain-containing sensor protein
VLAVALILPFLPLQIIAEPRLRIFDLEQRLWPSVSDPVKVAIVTIDNESLAQYGQWPWPRSFIAKLIRRISEGHPRILGIDIVFAERDRLSPPEIAHEVPGLPRSVADALARLPASEHELAEAMRAVPTVIALAPGSVDMPPSSDPLRPALILQAGGDPRPYLGNLNTLLRSQSEIEEAARGAGVDAVDPDADGVTRRVALAMTYRGTIVPSFALAVLSIGGWEPVVISTGKFGVKDIQVGVYAIPTVEYGHAMPHFAKPIAPYSAADVLDPGFDLSKLQSRIVLLGLASVVTGSIRQTPLGIAQGVDIHAQLIESTLLGTFLSRPPYLDAVEAAMALVAGLVAIFLLRYDRPARASGVILAIVAGFIVCELGAFRLAGLLLDGTYPAATLIAVFGVMLVGNLRAAQAELKRVETELAAARAIQMGLLPRRFAARSDIEVFGRVEPAEEIGGDLYDYLLIDRDRRLFFLIADVSGHGIPAALFMAATKQVLRDAALQFGTALDRIIAEANRKTAGESPDVASGDNNAMFVTAFVGILELGTGELHYASAGHASPVVIGNDGALRRLVTAGGPPLGVIEGFSYPVDHARIEPGAILLLYTDGVTEAQNPSRELYTLTRLESMLAAVSVTKAEHVVAAVIEDVRRFVGRAKQTDDMTLLALRRVADAPVSRGTEGSLAQNLAATG